MPVMMENANATALDSQLLQFYRLHQCMCRMIQTHSTWLSTIIPKFTIQPSPIATMSSLNLKPTAQYETLAPLASASLQSARNNQMGADNAPYIAHAITSSQQLLTSVLLNDPTSIPHSTSTSFLCNLVSLQSNHHQQFESHHCSTYFTRRWWFATKSQVTMMFNFHQLQSSTLLHLPAGGTYGLLQNT